MLDRIIRFGLSSAHGNRKTTIQNTRIQNKYIQISFDIRAGRVYHIYMIQRIRIRASETKIQGMKSNFWTTFINRTTGRFFKPSVSKYYALSPEGSGNTELFSVNLKNHPKNYLLIIMLKIICYNISNLKNISNNEHGARVYINGVFFGRSQP